MKRLLAAVLTFAIASSGLTAFAADKASGSGTNSSAGAGGGKVPTLAFPTAEGGGMYTKGARAALEGGKDIEVYHVTNLNDSGTGSFRDAVSKGNRIVVFDVSGMIDLQSNVSISHDNMTILGQTAPGDGICFRGDNIKVGADNVILRYLRFRVGAKHADGAMTSARDGLEVTDDVNNAIIDHCSVSWGTDENLSAYAVKDVTIQWSIIAEALNQSVHSKGEHSYGAIWGGVNLSIHHNLIATHKSRNPKIGTSETVAMTEGYTDADTVVDIRNNVIYNWGDKAGYGAENGANVNLVNNYYRPGPSTPENKKARIFELSPGNKYQPNWSGAVYAGGNYIDCDNEDAQAVNADNWQIERKTGVYLDVSTPTYEKLDAPNETYLADYPINTTDAKTAYEEVLENAGARMPKLDLVDKRIIDNVKNGTAPDGSKGSVGLVDDPTDGVPEADAALYDDRGYPAWVSESRGADYDTDGDGLPDAWEDKMGLNKENPTDSLFIGPEGYTYLEIFAEEGITHGESDISLTVDGSQATVASQKGGSVDIYVDDERVDTVNLSGDIPAGSTLISAAYDDEGVLTEVSSEIYESGEAVFPQLTKTGNVKHFIWDSLSGMRPVETAGTEPVSIDLSADTGMHTVTAVASDGSAYSNVDYLCVEGPVNYPGSFEGDFTAVMRLNNIPTMVKNSYGFLGMSNGDTGIYLGAGCNESYKKTIYYTDGTMPLKGATMLKAERQGNTISLYSGTSLLDWTLIKSYAVTENATTVIFRDEFPQGEKNAVNIDCSFINEVTKPQIEITNVTENQRLGFNENIEVNVTPDSAAVEQIEIALDDVVIASEKVNITNAQKATIPVSFAEIASGTLTVSCVDANLCTASDSVNVTVSADPSPWSIADIGVGADEIKTYLSVTNDYTYKINACDGLIGGTSDKFGYMYRQFDEDARIYARLRVNGADQIGFVIRNSLDADGAAYYVGCDKTSSGREYKVMGRSADGAEMTKLADLNISGDKAFLIVEKLGNTINIYETEGNPTVYTTKTLLYTITDSKIDNTYYMGFGADGRTEEGSAPDAGWLGIETAVSSDLSYHIWDFDHGLDWCWQMQEANVLRPSWTEESVGGRNGGKMVIAPDESYSGERYIFREYTMDDGLCPQMSSVVMLTGESPALNIYFQTGESAAAYKVTFDSDGKIKDSAGTELGSYDINQFYRVNMLTDIDAAAMDTVCRLIVVTDNSTEDIIVDESSIPSDADFRKQINTEKKTPVTKAVYFEPVAGADGTYYADDTMVWGKDSEYEIVTTDKLYTFDKAESYEGLTLSGVTPDTSKNKKIDGISFTGAARIGKPTTTMTFPVPGDCEISIYAASASSSESRAIVLNDGTEHELTFSSPEKQTYKYTGEARNIVISGMANVDIFGVRVTTKQLSTKE